MGEDEPEGGETEQGSDLASGQSGEPPAPGPSGSPPDDTEGGGGSDESELEIRGPDDEGKDGGA